MKHPVFFRCCRCLFFSVSSVFLFTLYGLDLQDRIFFSILPFTFSYQRLFIGGFSGVSAVVVILCGI